LSFFQHF